MKRKRGLSLLLILCLLLLLSSSISAKATTNGYTQAQAVEWIKSKEGQGGGECVDLIKQYINTLGHSLGSIGYAYNLYRYSEENLGLTGWGWHRYYNSETPQPGDIVVFDANQYGVFGAGHCGLIYAVDANRFYYIDYNGGGNSERGTGRDKPLHNFSCVIRPDFPNPAVLGSPMNSGGSQVIPDGDYQLVPGTDDSMCLTIDSASSENGANAQIYQNAGNPAWIFNVEWLGSNAGYKITFKSSGKSLTVEGEDKRWSDLNVLQFGWNGIQANAAGGQQWVINKTGNGEYYTVQAMCSGFYLDVNGTNVQVAEGNGTASQQWEFRPLGAQMTSGGSQVIPDGDYHIVPESDSDMCLTIDSASKADGANAQIYPGIGNPVWAVNVKWLGANDGYKLIFNNSEKSLTVEGIYKQWGGLNVNQWSYYEDDGQKWVISKTGDGDYYTIQTRSSGYYLDVVDIPAVKNVRIWIGNGSSSQKWKFVPYAVDVENVSLDRNALTLHAGDQEFLKVTISPANATDKALTWTSSDSLVVDVDDTGIVTAKSEGTATITVKSANGKMASCQITVEKEQEDHTHTYENTWKSDEDNHWKECECGNKSKVAPHDFVWESDDEALTEGSRHEVCSVCGYIGKTESGSSGDTDEVDVEAVSLDKSVLIVSVGSQESLKATISPENATDKALTWESSDSSVVDVDDTGIITAKSEGIATITIKSANGKTASCRITVEKEKEDHTHTYEIAWKSDEDNHWKECECGNKSEFAPHDFVWESDDEALTEASKYEVCSVCGYIGKTESVSGGDKDKVDVEAVSLDRSVLTVRVGNQESLKATISPENATDKTLI